MEALPASILSGKPFLQLLYLKIQTEAGHYDWVEQKLRSLAGKIGEADWEALKAVDETQTSSASDTYNTAAKTLPTNYLHTLDGGNALYIGDSRSPYFLIPFERREQFKNTARRWF